MHTVLYDPVLMHRGCPTAPFLASLREKRSAHAEHGIPITGYWPPAPRPLSLPHLCPPISFFSSPVASTSAPIPLPWTVSTTARPSLTRGNSRRSSTSSSCATWTCRCSLDAQPAGVENLEPDFGVTPPQGTLRPLAFKLAQHVLPLHHSQPTPFHLGHEQLLAVVGVGRDAIQFDVAFPIRLRARKARPAHIFKHRCGVVVNELPLFLDRIDRIDACQTLCLPDITLPVLARRKEALDVPMTPAALLCAPQFPCRCSCQTISVPPR